MTQGAIVIVSRGQESAMDLRHGKLRSDQQGQREHDQRWNAREHQLDC
jgi:hypothetical protein